MAGHDWHTLRTKWTCSIVNTITNNESVVASGHDNARICNRFFIILLVNLSTMLLTILASFIVLNKQDYLNEHAYAEKALINETAYIDTA